MARHEGLRNRIVHGYFEIDLNVVWDTLQAAVPDLLARLEGFARKASRLEAPLPLTLAPLGSKLEQISNEEAWTMSLGGSAEMARLKRAVAEIEGAGRNAAAPRVEPGGSERGASAVQRLPVARAFDRALNGGLADDALHEIVPASPMDGAATMGFALALAARLLDGREASGLVVSEAFTEREAGALYGPGLVAHGLPLGRLVFVRAPDADMGLWAMEEALKCGAPAVVVGEIWSLKGYSLTASRRLLHRRAKGADAGAARAGERLRPGGQAVERGRDALRDRRRAERENSRGGRPGPARPLRL